MQWLAAICVKRPVLATVIILVFVVVGLAGYSRLAVDRFPKVDFPNVVVLTRMDGATPKEIESEITDKIEEAVNTISGIDDLRSVSSEGISQVIISFVLEKNIDVAAQEVRDRVNRALSQLPKGIDQPIVEKLDPDAAPILNLALVADKPVRDITEFADKILRRQIEGVQGVGQVTLLGGRKRQINIWLDPIRLQSFGLTAIEVQRAFDLQNVQIPGGAMKSSAMERNLRVFGRAESVEEIRRLVVRQRDGQLIRVSDVARVEDGEQEADSVARKDGVSTVLLSIRRQSGENTITVVDAIKDRLTTIRKMLPAGYRIDVVRDNSMVIRTSTGVVKEHLVLGSILAALVVLLFLGNSKATIISALAIPTSIISSFGVMWITNQTLNEISLLALALAVGIVIDDAIIVVENIFKHVEEKGEDPYHAAILGTREIGMAVMATTLSLMSIFIPVAFLGGLVGMFLKSFGLTMSFAIAISLLVSFTLAPALAARLFKRGKRQGVDQKLEHVVNLFYRPVENGYIWLLKHSMNHRWVVVLAAICAVLSSGPLMKIIGKDMLPPNEEAQFSVHVRMPEGTSLAATDLMAERIARQIRATSGVEYTLMTIGDNDQRTPNVASIYTHLVPPSDRKSSQSDIMDQIRRDLLPTLPGALRVSVQEVPPFNTGQSAAKIQYVVAGPNLEKLTQVAATAISEMKKLPGIRDVDSDLISGKPEITVTEDRSKAGQMGVSIADLSSTLRLLVGGLEVSTYEEGGEQYDIRLRAEEKYRNDPQALSLISVPSQNQGAIPVSLLNVVGIGNQEGPAQINRLNRRRQVTLLANNAPGFSEQDVLAGIEGIIKKQGLTSDYYTGPIGRTKEMKQVVSRFVTAFLLAFVFMYLILAAQFESWLHPFTILLALPLTLPFALAGLILMGQSFNIFSALGMLVLFGVVKKNGILQIDHMNKLRENGMARHDAIMLANKDRLRPILMTTAAFVAGMLPMLFASGIGSAFHKATAGVVVGGQTLSLLLTLIAIPVFYSLFDDAILWVRSRFSRREAGVAGAAESGTML